MSTLAISIIYKSVQCIHNMFTRHFFFITRNKCHNNDIEIEVRKKRGAVKKSRAMSFIYTYIACNVCVYNLEGHLIILSFRLYMLGKY